MGLRALQESEMRKEGLCVFVCGCTCVCVCVCGGELDLFRNVRPHIGWPAAALQSYIPTQ